MTVWRRTLPYVNRAEGIKRLREAEQLLRIAGHNFYEFDDRGEELTGHLCYVLGGLSQMITALADLIEEEGRV